MNHLLTIKGVLRLRYVHVVGLNLDITMQMYHMMHCVCDGYKVEPCGSARLHYRLMVGQQKTS